jgi:hypothetical protein
MRAKWAKEVLQIFCNNAISCALVLWYPTTTHLIIQTIHLAGFIGMALFAVNPEQKNRKIFFTAVMACANLYLIWKGIMMVW